MSGNKTKICLAEGSSGTVSLNVVQLMDLALKYPKIRSLARHPPVSSFDLRSD